MTTSLYEMFFSKKNTESTRRSKAKEGKRNSSDMDEEKDFELVTFRNHSGNSEECAFNKITNPSAKPLRSKAESSRTKGNSRGAGCRNSLKNRRGSSYSYEYLMLCDVMLSPSYL